jgi:outer membrane protein OmpU
MKKVLLATSALFLTAGVASAELTFSGTAGAGIFKQGKVAAKAAPTGAALTAANAALTEATTALSAATTKYNAGQISSADWLKAIDAQYEAWLGTQAVAEKKAADHYSVYSGIDIDITASTTTDNGMTISAKTDMGAGSLLDAADRELDAQTDDLTAPEVKITYSGVTVELESEGVQDYYDGDLDNYDIGISGSMGAISYGVALETDRKGGGSDWSANASYSANGLTVSLSTNEVNGEEDLTKVSASYAMGDATFTLTSDNKGKAKDVATFKVAYVAGPATITVSAANDKDNAGNTNKSKRGSYDVSVKYVTGAYTINATTNESDAWNANVAYDLGGGASMTVGADSTDTSFAGVSFAF